MKVIETTIPGVKVFEPKIYQDNRGFFFESFHVKRYQDSGVPLNFVQDNYSQSTINTLRGLHYQLKYPQGKLVSVSNGSVLDVALDIRRGSPTFGQYHSEILSDENHRQMYIPPGFAHGFSVLSEVVSFQYKCTEYYHPEDDYGVLWSDPDIAIEWVLKGMPLLSEKDQGFSALRDIDTSLLPEYCERPDSI